MAEHCVIGDAAVCPSIFLTMDVVFRELERHFPTRMSNFVLNIGAANGVDDDPVYPLMKERGGTSMGGVFIEYEGAGYAALAKTYAQFPYAQLINEGMNFNNLLTLPKGVNGTALAGGVAPTNNRAGPQRGGGPYPNPAAGRTLDIFKFDIDGCECHYLEEMMAKEPFFHAKLIEVETNHHIPPPIHYRDMCLNGENGRDGKGWDVWGCSAQAAYDILAPYGYEMLQYAWPDALFIKKEFAPALPCFRGTFEERYYVGRDHAEARYSRYAYHQDNRAFNAQLPQLAKGAVKNPLPVIEAIVQGFKHTFTKGSLWIELGISGTDKMGAVTRVAGNVEYHLHSGNRSK